MEWLRIILSFLSSVAVAFIAIIPAIISNRKKTQDSIREGNEATKQQFDAMMNDFDSHVREYEETKAKSQRLRILRFYDEMCERREHSESHFEDILDDIDDYELYCEKHPDFKNNRGKAAMEYIKAEYPKIKAKGGFLTHK